MSNQITESNISKNVLLLGAGFTKNFKGLLAEEMWAEIFNHKDIQAQPRIKKLMLNNFDYEEVYYSVLENLTDKNNLFPTIRFRSVEKKAMENATKSAYRHIDEILREQVSPLTIFSPVNDLIMYFRTNRQKYEYILDDGRTAFIFPEYNSKSFIFTLNQDLFFERFYFNNDNAELSIPGIVNDPEWFTSSFNKPFESKGYCKLPTRGKLNSIKSSLLEVGNFFLIKLHGSCNWISSKGSNIMVIGKGKAKQIENEPLLEYYFNIFDGVISQDQCRLLVIGYGFGDEHINRIISEAIKKHGLKLYILSPESPKKLKEKLCEEHKTEETIIIWNGISGYFQDVEAILLDDRKSQAIRERFYNILFSKDNDNSIIKI